MEIRKQQDFRLYENFFENTKIRYLDSLENGSFYCLNLIHLLTISRYHNKYFRYLEIKFDCTIDLFISLVLHIDKDSAKDLTNQLLSLSILRIEDDIVYIESFPPDDIERDRNLPEYKQWRLSVFERDDYTCQKCNCRGEKLNAHHIKGFARFPELRYEISNGITLCVGCHKMEHKNGRQ